jgi:hypothetical protein
VTVRPFLAAFALSLALPLVLAGCSSAPATQAPAPVCRLKDFLGDWVDTRRGDEGLVVGRGAVTVIAGRVRTRIAYVAPRDFGPVTRQVLRQEFANLATLGSLPPAKGGPGETVCAIHLIRRGGAAALVTDGRQALIFLEESGAMDPPTTMRLRRGRPAPSTAPDLLTPPS